MARPNNLAVWRRLGQSAQQTDRTPTSSRRGAAKGSRSDRHHLRSSLIIILACALVFGAFLTVVISRNTSHPILDAANIAEKIAQGNLQAKIITTRHDEIGELLNSVGTMSNKLAQVIGDVNRTTKALSAASARVFASAQPLSRGTSEQAAAVEQTASSLEEINASISHNAENSRQMEHMALKGAKEMEESGKAVAESVDAMKTIAEKISIVKEIAYQTNLLDSQCRHRSGESRRARQRLCRSRHRSEKTCRQKPSGGPRNQLPHLFQCQSRRTLGRTAQ